MGNCGNELQARRCPHLRTTSNGPSAYAELDNKKLYPRERLPHPRYLSEMAPQTKPLKRRNVPAWPECE